MNPEYQLQLLKTLYDDDFLQEISKRNNIIWGEEDEEGPSNNFEGALLKFLEEGNTLDVDFMEDEDKQRIIQSLTDLREVHKKYMVPQIRAVMNKIKGESEDISLSGPELLEQAYELLSLYGGAQWNSKLNTLHYYSSRIRELSESMEDTKDTE